MKEAIIMFTRVPIPGKTKTRLEGYLSKNQCAKIHSAFLKDIYESCKKTNKDIFIFYTSVDSVDILKNILGENKYCPQIGENLGEKMFNAMNFVLNKDYNSCVLIGCDIPEVNENILNNAFERLEKVDVVLGPTFDKGYYLVGMKSPYKSIFQNKTYGTGDVLLETTLKIKEANLTFDFVDTLLDIDEKEDVLTLIKNLKNKDKCYYTKEFLKTLGEW